MRWAFPRDQPEYDMTDDPKKTGLDRKLIAMHEPREVCSWMPEGSELSLLELNRREARND